MKTDIFEDEVTIFDDGSKENFGRKANDEAIKSERVTDELPLDLVTPPRKINVPADDSDNYRHARPRIF